MDDLGFWMLVVLAVLILLFIIWHFFYRTQQNSPSASLPSAESPAHSTSSTQQVDISPKPKLPPLAQDGPRWRVLIVDDLPRWADAVQRYSQLLPCDTRHTSSLTAAVQSLDAWQPQLILLDLHMPRDDWQPEPTLYQKYGADQKTLAFCEQVTHDPAYQNMMVVVTSVEEQYEEQNNALRAGAFRFYTKEDFRLEDLEKLLQILQVRLAQSPP